jgi:hypothetical protein
MVGPTVMVPLLSRISDETKRQHFKRGGVFDDDFRRLPSRPCSAIGTQRVGLDNRALATRGDLTPSAATTSAITRASLGGHGTSTSFPFDAALSSSSWA